MMLMGRLLRFDWHRGLQLRSLQSLRYGKGQLQVLDQLKIPGETVYVVLL